MSLNINTKNDRKYLFSLQTKRKKSAIFVINILYFNYIYGVLPITLDNPIDFLISDIMPVPPIAFL